MNKNAKVVFRGEIFDVYQWEQELYDGSTATFERLKRPDTTQIIGTFEDKIIIIEQTQPDRETSFSFPGGRREEGEDILVSAKREFLEETGYASDDWELWRTDDPASKIDWTIYTYIARDCVFKEEPNPDAGEKISVKIITFDELLLMTDDPKFFIRDLGNIFIKARYVPEEREKLRKLLFGK